MHRDPEALRRARVAAADAFFTPRPSAAPTPPVVARHRRAWVQADYRRDPRLPGAHLGTVPWEEHVEACERPVTGLPKSAEAEGNRGGMRWDEMVARLGREPRGWRRA